MKVLRILLSALLAIAAFGATSPRRVGHFTATATSQPGITAKGTTTHEGIVAADPAILPLGSRMSISNAGPYSGAYVVTDTGSNIVGHKIDIYLRSRAEAKQFGKKLITVRVLSIGNNKKNGREATRPRQ